MPKVSIVIPVYNLGNLLHRCLGSVLTQTHSDIQLLLIDDGSSDNSLSLCQQYAEKDSRIEVFHHQNHGVSYTRNVGISQATGDYIIFIDGDDTISSTYIADLVRDAESSGADIVLCGIQRVHENQEVEAMRLARAHPDKKSFWEFCCTSRSPLVGYAPNKLYRLSLIKENNLSFNTSMHAQEDLDFALRAYSRARSIVISEVCGYSYFYAPGKRHMPVQDLLRNQIALYNFARESGAPPHALYSVSRLVQGMLFAYLYSQPEKSHIEQLHSLPGLADILRATFSLCIRETQFVAFLFINRHFRALQGYMRARSFCKSLLTLSR